MEDIFRSLDILHIGDIKEFSCYREESKTCLTTVGVNRISEFVFSSRTRLEIIYEIKYLWTKLIDSEICEISDIVFRFLYDLYSISVILLVKYPVLFWGFYFAYQTPVSIVVYQFADISIFENSISVKYKYFLTTFYTFQSSTGSFFVSLYMVSNRSSTVTLSKYFTKHFLLIVYDQDDL